MICENITEIYWVEDPDDDRKGSWVETNIAQECGALKFDHAGKLQETMRPDGSVLIWFADGPTRVWLPGLGSETAGLPEWETRFKDYLL
jgi:hypothetical protein